MTAAAPEGAALAGADPTGPVPFRSFRTGSPRARPAMPQDRDDLIDGVVGLLQQFGLELAFIDPVEENKVERIAPLLERLEELIGEADALPEPLVMAMIAIRRWVDDRIAVDRCLNAETILLFQEWQP